MYAIKHNSVLLRWPLMHTYLHAQAAIQAHGASGQPPPFDLSLDAVEEDGDQPLLGPHRRASASHEQPKNVPPLTEEEQILQDFWEDVELRDSTFEPEDLQDLEQHIERVAQKYNDKYDALKRAKMAQL